MDITTLRILATLACFVTFLGILVWAYSRRNSARFDEAARIPFEREEQP
ncbi:MAG: cbb3-type cytochrome oxidase subunit 3 [Ramlibacter sp.]|nr:cbb3-type cytochrome c oxidase subunit 3 [Ramlibacter sp.]